MVHFAVSARVLLRTGRRYRVGPNVGPTLGRQLGICSQNPWSTCDFWAKPVTFACGPQPGRDLADRRDAVQRRPAGLSGPPGRLSALSVFLCKSVFYGAFVWARRALNSQKWRARPVFDASLGTFDGAYDAQYPPSGDGYGMSTYTYLNFCLARIVIDNTFGVPSV